MPSSGSASPESQKAAGSMNSMSTQSCAAVPWPRHGLGSGRVVPQQPEPLTWARTSCAHTACPPCPCVPSGAVPICQCSLPARQGPANITENSAQAQARPSYFSSPSIVVDLVMSVTWDWFRTSLQQETFLSSSF